MELRHQFIIHVCVFNIGREGEGILVNGKLKVGVFPQLGTIVISKKIELQQWKDTLTNNCSETGQLLNM